MALNPLQAALRGRIRPTGATQGVLVLALAGLLSFGGDVIPTPTPSFSSGGGVDFNILNENRLRRQRVREDEEILAIMSVIIRCL